MADPFKISNIFEYSLDLLEKPFIKDRKGNVYFSILWLFDSLIYNLTYLLGRNNIGKIRGVRNGIYLAYVIENYIRENFSDIQLIGPFKLILSNNNRDPRGLNYRKLKKSLENFKYDFFEIFFSENELDGKRLSFIEFDFAFIFNNILFVAEVKDNLFWDLRDLPYANILWGKKNNKKLEKKCEYLKLSKVKRKLNNKGINYIDVKGAVISPKYVVSEELPSIYEFFDLINQEHIREKKGIDSKCSFIINLNWPEYPWDD